MFDVIRNDLMSTWGYSVAHFVMGLCSKRLLYRVFFFYLVLYFDTTVAG